jgi:protein FAM50
VRKGDSIGVFLKAVREQLAPQFRELRAVSVDNMMYIKVCEEGGSSCWAASQ